MVRSRVEWNDAPVMASVRAASGAGAASAARKLLRMAVPRTPRQTGAMAESGGYVVVDGIAIVGFERPGRDGAIVTRRQHEDLTLRHAHGEAKWLERSVEEYAGQAIVDMAAVVSGVL